MQIQSPAHNPISSTASTALQRGHFRKPPGLQLAPRPAEPAFKPKPTAPTFEAASKPMPRPTEPAFKPKPAAPTFEAAPKPTAKPLEIRPGNEPTIQSSPPVLNEPLPPPTQDPQPLTLQGLMDAWGQTDSPYDLNSDGTVNVNDLLIFLNNWEKYGPQNNTSTPAGSPPTTPPAASGGGQPAALSANKPAVELPKSPLSATGGSLAKGNVNQLSQSLFDHLSAAGFADQPPVNIRELVDALNPSPRQADLMLKQLAEKYPEGLSVNVVA